MVRLLFWCHCRCTGRHPAEAVSLLGTLQLPVVETSAPDGLASRGRKQVQQLLKEKVESLLQACRRGEVSRQFIFPLLPNSCVAFVVCVVHRRLLARYARWCFIHNPWIALV